VNDNINQKIRLERPVAIIQKKVDNFNQMIIAAVNILNDLQCNSKPKLMCTTKTSNKNSLAVSYFELNSSIILVCMLCLRFHLKNSKSMHWLVQLNMKYEIPSKMEKKAKVILHRFIG
jgi:hypothetical protein